MEMALAANDDIFIVHFFIFRLTGDIKIYKEIRSQNHLFSLNWLRIYRDKRLSKRHKAQVAILQLMPLKTHQLKFKNRFQNKVASRSILWISKNSLQKK